MEWHGPDENGILRAYDDYALYVISCDAGGRYQLSYFPSPGPECPWGEPHGTVEAAKVAAEECVRHVRSVRESLVTTPTNLRK